MKKLIILNLLLSGLFFSFTLPNQNEIGSCFNKSNKKSIDKKMDKLLEKVSAETNCPADQINYQVEEYYSTFYTKECRHLPKKITFETCSEKRTYKNTSISGSVTYWLMGSWQKAN
jgi:hypothetical protein